MNDFAKPMPPAKSPTPVMEFQQMHESPPPSRLFSSKSGSCEATRHQHVVNFHAMPRHCFALSRRLKLSLPHPRVSVALPQICLGVPAPAPVLILVTFLSRDPSFGFRPLFFNARDSPQTPIDSQKVQSLSRNNPIQSMHHALLLLPSSSTTTPIPIPCPRISFRRLLLSSHATQTPPPKTRVCRLQLSFSSYPYSTSPLTSISISPSPSPPISFPNFLV